jgi:hypothetical protein
MATTRQRKPKPSTPLVVPQRNRPTHDHPRPSRHRLPHPQQPTPTSPQQPHRPHPLPSTLHPPLELAVSVVAGKPGTTTATTTTSSPTSSTPSTTIPGSDCSSALAVAGEDVMDTAWTASKWPDSTPAAVKSCGPGAFQSRYRFVAQGWDGFTLYRGPLPAASRRARMRVRAVNGTTGVVRVYSQSKSVNSAIVDVSLPDSGWHDVDIDASSTVDGEYLILVVQTRQVQCRSTLTKSLFAPQQGEHQPR